MFSKNSRYRKLPDEVTLDAKGRQLLSKSLRLLPEVTGRFRHALDENDRLDHLAYKYYKQPRKWWHICDANPDFLSPHDLLGTTPVISQRFPVSFDGSGDAPWALLLADIMKHVGVMDAGLEEDEETGIVTAVVIVYNQMNINAKELAGIIEDMRFTVRQPQTIGRVGKLIVIPPDVSG